MSRPARVCINLHSLRHNLSRVRSLAPGSHVLAIIKADAYGHGIVRVARALDAADAFGVACLEEATALREAGIRQPIVLLEGPFDAEDLESIERLRLQTVIHDPVQIEMLERSRIRGPIKIWLKIDTGMHRLGLRPGDLNPCIERLRRCACVDDDIVLMTHLACASEPGHVLTDSQLQLFSSLTASMRLARSVANSAAVLSIPESHCDWVRPGIMLYGVSPFAGETGADHGLEPAMTFRTRLIAIKSLQAGDSVGYGAVWRCPAPMTVGIVAAGYGDGYPRHALSGTPVLVNGQRTRLLGYASMDMLAVDLSTIADARIGDPVTLWGEGLPVEEIAASAATIAYELISSVQKRLQFVEDGPG